MNYAITFIAGMVAGVVAGVFVANMICETSADLPWWMEVES